jgi:hypothetical protein
MVRRGRSGARSRRPGSSCTGRQITRKVGSIAALQRDLMPAQVVGAPP